MSSDAELDLIRHGVNCATVLEQLAGGWKLDKRQSTRRALKYRRGAGEIIIVNHDGRGWWDATGSAKGDVFSLVRYLEPGLNFHQVRQALRRFVGAVPSYPKVVRQAKTGPDRPLPARWNACPRLRPGCHAWTYLADMRGLPAVVLWAAAEADTVRASPHGSAWFAHRDEHDDVSHIEIRGPDFKGSVRGGHKTLFALSRHDRKRHVRLVLAEAPIDALSLAALEGIRDDTAYLATGGGMGPGTIAAIERTLIAIAAQGGSLVSATDANLAGDRYAERHAELAAAAGVPFMRLRPTSGADWNDVLLFGRECDPTVKPPPSTKAGRASGQTSIPSAVAERTSSSWPHRM